MLIHELAQRTGVSTKTIRYYESVGLLPCPQRASNHYRLYTEADVELLRFIVGARSLGYPVTEIAQFLAARNDGSLPCQQVLVSLSARLQEIERRIADLQAVRATLEQIQQEATSHPQPPACDDQCVCHLLTIVTANRQEESTMMREKQTDEKQSALACNPTALEATGREQHFNTAKQVFAAVLERRELPDGYAFRLSEEHTTIPQVAEFITNERRCCPFFHFMLSVEPQGGAVWLTLTGPEGAKETFETLFQSI
jgi:DNA-binding transcriptional MerR regulator